ncbi:MAG: hypothetical protein R2724_28310 [Bryobacterales bacterium]
MKRKWLSGGLNPLAIAGMTGALILLAALQYRWIGEMAEADRERLQRGAEASANQFRDDFNRELLRLARVFDIGNDALLAHDWPEFAARLASWRSAGGGYLAVDTLYVRDREPNGEDHVLQLSADGSALNLANCRRRLSACSSSAGAAEVLEEVSAAASVEA